MTSIRIAVLMLFLCLDAEQNGTDQNKLEQVRTG